MLPAFDHNAAFIWAIYTIGFAVPVLMLVYCSLRLRLASRRLERLKKEKGG